MKITDVIGSFVDREQGVAPVGNFMQQIANAFTRSGQVKRPLSFQPIEAQSAASSVSREDIPPDVSAGMPPLMQLNTPPRDATGCGAPSSLSNDHVSSRRTVCQ